MTYRNRILTISSVLLFLLCYTFSWLKNLGATPVPVPSHPGGYYGEEFLLTLEAPENGKIYYTTDGSIPTIESAVYQGGIFIRDRSSEENIYNAVQNVVVDWKTYTPNPDPVPKGTVVRALYINNWGMESQILTQTYFVGLEAPTDGYTLSLVFEYDDLYGENGIYVTGKEYDDWYLFQQDSDVIPVPNFQKRLEVPVTAQLMDDSGDLLNQTAALRLQGSSKRGWIQKRFILEANPVYTGSNLFPAEIFPETATHSVMTKDALPDAMVQELVSDRAVASQKSVPVRLFLNGEFLYEWYLLERYDNQYFRQYYNVDDIILVKDSVVDEDVTIDRDAYGELMYWAAHTDFSVEEEWIQINKEIDVQSYIDYLSINYYLCNWDFSDDKNHVLWRSTIETGTPYGDKRWRWCIYDIDALEFTLDNYSVENAAEVNIFSCELPYCDVKVNETVLFRALKNNSDFCRQFVLSFMDIVNNNFTIENISAVLEKHGRTQDWKDGFFQKRPEYAARHLAEEFGLTGTLETVTVAAENPEMGRIVVNTSQIDLSDGSWSGQYFTDYPITVTAVPHDGYAFLGWKGDADTTADSVTVSVDGGIALEAVFAEIE